MRRFGPHFVRPHRFSDQHKPGTEHLEVHQHSCGVRVPSRFGGPQFRRARKFSRSICSVLVHSFRFRLENPRPLQKLTGLTHNIAPLFFDCFYSNFFSARRIFSSALHNRAGSQCKKPTSGAAGNIAPTKQLAVCITLRAGSFVKSETRIVARGFPKTFLEPVKNHGCYIMREPCI